MRPKHILFFLPLLLLLLIPTTVAAAELVILVDTTLTADHEGTIVIRADDITLDCDDH